MYTSKWLLDWKLFFRCWRWRADASPKTRLHDCFSNICGSDWPDDCPKCFLVCLGARLCAKVCVRTPLAISVFLPR